MRFQCPSCKDIITAPDGQYGKKVICQHCKTPTLTPESAFGSGMAIGDFIIIKQLGSGGAGVVYLAHQISLDRPAALKILRNTKPDATDDPVQDLIREARSAGKLNHPNIVQAYAVGEDSGIFYFAMEYIDGETMKSVLKREGTLDAKRAASIIKQIADALQFAWDKQKLTHRDIKPDNIMLTTSNQAKLADLGLSRRAGEHIEEDDSDEVMGTPQYISPEQLTGAPVDTRSDIYSLGATFYQFVTGRFPYEGPDVNEIAKQHVIGNLTPPREVNYNVPEEINRIIMKMMSRYPENRYQSPGELSKDLDAFLNPAPAQGGLSAGSRLRNAALEAASAQSQLHGGAAAPTLGGGLRQGGMRVLEAPSSGGSALKAAFHRPSDSSSEGEKPHQLHTIGLDVPASLEDAVAGTQPASAKKTLKLNAVEAPPPTSKASAVMPVAQKKSSGGVWAMLVVLLIVGLGIVFFLIRNGGNKSSGRAVSHTTSVSTSDGSDGKKSDTAGNYSDEQLKSVFYTPVEVSGDFVKQLNSKYINFVFAVCETLKMTDSEAAADRFRLMREAIAREALQDISEKDRKAGGLNRLNNMLSHCREVLELAEGGMKIRNAVLSGDQLVGMELGYQNATYVVDSVNNGKVRMHMKLQPDMMVDVVLFDPQMSYNQRKMFIEEVGNYLGVKYPYYSYGFCALAFDDIARLRSSDRPMDFDPDEFVRAFFKISLRYYNATANDLAVAFRNQRSLLEEAKADPLP
ncbi:MAG: serine/threonine protein kinase [Victivallaceae bacterium]|nr:serine/threonine-protein kinase [Victivallaceae bacterium]